jgi:hypothetical protein
MFNSAKAGIISLVYCGVAKKSDDRKEVSNEQSQSGRLENEMVHNIIWTDQTRGEQR